MTIALERGVKLRVIDASGVPSLLTYVGRSKQGGYKLKLLDEEPEIWSPEKMIKLRIEGKVEIYSGDPDVDDDWISQVLSRTMSSFPPEYQAVAFRKVAYCIEMKRRVDRGETADACAAAVARDVFTENEERWLKEDAAIEHDRETVAEKRRKIPSLDLKRPRKPRRPELPSAKAVCEWYRLWRRYRKDVRILLPAWNKRGQSGPRYESQIYKLMDEALEEHYLQRHVGSTARHAYGEFEKLCKRAGLLSYEETSKRGLPRQYPSYVTFNTHKNEFISARDETRIREGSRKAFLSFTVFQRQGRPIVVLGETEIDHSLIDCVVVHPVTGRPLGRPWLTALLDRASSMILGMHLSLAAPSFPSVQRCLAHAFWPKDLSAFPDLENPWPCEGIPMEIFTDNGKEFHSNSLTRAEEALTFRLRPLPVMSPWLKGKIERFFGRFGVQTLGHKAGKTFSSIQKRGDYNPAKAAVWTMPQLRDDLLRYIVDEYHVTRHRGLNDAKPLDVWNDLVEKQGGVRAVSSYDQVVELMGQHLMRPLSNSGININGINYWSPQFTQLKEDLGRSKDWVECRFDPFDLREIAVLNKTRGSHIRAVSTNAVISHGVSYSNSKAHLKAARMSGGGKHVTEDDIRSAKERMEQDAERILGAPGKRLSVAKTVAAYSEPNGAFFTPVAGRSGVAQAAPLVVTAQPTPSAPMDPPLVPRDEASPSAATGTHEDLSAEVDAFYNAWKD
jgi:putative transposase